MKRRFLTLVLAVLMMVSTVPAAVFAEDGGRATGWYGAYISKTDKAPRDKFVSRNNAPDGAGYAPNDVVRVSIVLESLPTMEKYGVAGIAGNKAAANYRAKLRTEQDNAAKRISAIALGGKKLDVVWNLTLAVNLISANVEYGKIEKIKKIPGVKSVVLENRYNPETTVPDGAAEPKMIVGAEMTNTYSLWAQGYTGAGTSVAIIDTGIDVDHISFDAGAFEYSLGTLDKEVDLLTADDVAAVLDQLNVKINDPELTVDDLYRNAKIPFAYNYVDKNTDVSHLNDTKGAHGSHVAGIAGANRCLPDGNGGYVDALSSVYTQGQAPDAQLFAMKVFGQRGGAFDSDYFAALEDAIVLGADSANLSLGSSNSGFTANEVYSGVYEKLKESDTLMVTSAGNNGSWFSPTYEGYPYADDKNFNTVGDPASNAESLSVASVNNSGLVAPTIKFLDRSIFYTETEGGGRDMLRSFSGEYEFIAIDSIGTEEEFAAVADVLAGKIALCWRGELYFSEKANNAAKYGAAAVVICNNKTDAISMNLDGYEYTNPAVMISLEDANYIFGNAEAVTDPETGDALYYTGTFTLSDGVEVSDPDVDYYKMSDFSSWGVPGSLILKPEITAPGGSIYSVSGACLDEKGNLIAGTSDQYKIDSGTSMASPQIAGITALLSEYIDENDLTAKTGMTRRQLITALLMGTAQPFIEEDTDNYYSVLLQGAGLVDAEAALNTQTLIKMHEDATGSRADGKVKAELGVVGRDEDSFRFGFDVTNFGDEDVEYDLDAKWFTQDIFLDSAFDVNGEVKYDENESPVSCEYMDTYTTDLSTHMTWIVNGEPIVREEDTLCDFDGDGIFTYDDVLELYFFSMGYIEEVANCSENIDVNEDGSFNSDDVDYLFSILNYVVIDVAAGETASLEVVVELRDIDYHDYSGAYIEGYVFVSEYFESEGAYGVESSIPVLGYYGDWSEPSMFDHGSALDYYHGVDVNAPYMASQIKEESLYSKAFQIKYQDGGVYLAAGNPFVSDPVYIPERNAISPHDSIDSVIFSLIRDSAATEIVVTDEGGSELYKNGYGMINAAYYSADDQEWKDYRTFLKIGYTPSELEDGTVITATLRAAPEYYVGEEGEVDWDSLADGTRFSQQFTVDGTGPEIISVDVHYNEELGGYDAVKVTAKDNQFVSMIRLEDEDGNEVGVVGSDPDVEALPGSEYEYIFDLTGLFEDLSSVPAHMLVTVCDYATNWSDYYINLNAEELEDPYEIIADSESITVPLGNTRKTGVTVTPWGKPFTLVWTSENEEIATVDEHGTVSGNKAGTTVIKAALAEAPDVFVTIEVNVKEKHKALDGILWDEEGGEWFVSFDSSDLSAYEKLTADPQTLNMMGFCYDEHGTAYVSTFDPETWASELYAVDDETYELTFIGSSDAGYYDIAAAPGVSQSLGTGLISGVYATYMFWIDKESGEIAYNLDMSSLTYNDYLSGIAYAGSYYDEEQGIVDEYYLLDMNGYLYMVDVVVYDTGEGLDVEILSGNEVGQIAAPVDYSYFQSLYLDTEGDLIWSRTNTEENMTELICIEVTEEEGLLTYHLGFFPDKVWPVAGIHESGAALAMDYVTMICGDEPEWKWNEDHTAAYACFTDPIGAELSYDAQITAETIAPTCEAAGSIVYTATLTIGSKTFTDVETVPNGEALDHDYGEWTVVTPATYYDEGLEQRVCSHDPSHIETRPIAKLSILPGDVNGDGKLNAKDVTAIMKHLINKTPAGFVIEAADFNGDGKLNAKDVVALMRSLIN